MELSCDHVWGKNIGAQRKGLADNVERRLKETQKLVAAALPTLPGKLANQRRRLPRLSSPPDPAAVTRALTLLAFTREVRTSANYAGFGGPLAQLTEKLEDMLDHYVQDVIDAIRSGEADVDVCNGFLMVAADFNGLIRDNRAADLVRRRAAAAMKGDSPPLAETG